MFGIGFPEMVVLALVGLVVLGPDRLPGLARAAARMVRTLRALSTGAREQLREELGPEFADVDLRSLNPRTVISRAVLGEEFDLTKYDPRRFDARAAARSLFTDDTDAHDAGIENDDLDKPVSFDKRASVAHDAGGDADNGDAADTRPERPRPRPRPGPGRPSAAPDVVDDFGDAT